MFVGGEFYDDSNWLIQSPALNTEDLYFLNGGRACLMVIADYLLSIGISRVLIPSYLCPSILDVFDKCEFRSNRTVKRRMPHSGKENRQVRLL